MCVSRCGPSRRGPGPLLQYADRRVSSTLLAQSDPHARFHIMLYSKTKGMVSNVFGNIVILHMWNQDQNTCEAITKMNGICWLLRLLALRSCLALFLGYILIAQVCSRKYRRGTHYWRCAPDWSPFIAHAPHIFLREYVPEQQASWDMRSYAAEGTRHRYVNKFDPSRRGPGPLLQRVDHILSSTLLMQSHPHARFLRILYSKTIAVLNKYVWIICLFHIKNKPGHFWSVHPDE